jgi:DNA replication protein DnaC
MNHLRIKVCPQPGHCPGLYIPTNVPPDHPEFGQSLPCACTRRRQATDLLRALPAGLRHMTFDAFQPADAAARGALDLVREFASDPWRDKYFLTLVGPNQRGKTHLAAALVNTLLVSGEPAFFENVPALLDQLRGGYGDDKFYAVFLRVKTAAVLVLDDLGAEQQGGGGGEYGVTWAQDKLYQIVDHRVVHRLPTLVTTNLTRAQLPDRLATRLWNGRYAIVKAVSGVSVETNRSAARP